MLENMRRPKTEIAKSLLEFLKNQENPFYRASLEEIKMNPQTAEDWLEIYMIFNSGPKIKKHDLGQDSAKRNRFVYEVIQ